MSNLKYANSAIAESSTAQYDRMFQDFDGKTSVRSDYNRGDYDYFRPSEQLPKTPKESIDYSNAIYYAPDAGIIKNTIDLMSDFACYGIKISHPNPRQQRFYQAWFEKVDGYVVSERFLNYLYRLGNVFVEKTNAKIKSRIAREMKRTRAEAINQAEAANTVPIKYTFLNPCSIDTKGGKLGILSGEPLYVVKIGELKSELNELKKFLPKDAYQKFYDSLPPVAKKAIESKSTEVPIDRATTYIEHYRKDDCQDFAMPLMNSILGPWQMIRKMHLADINALDGAISQVRLWTLGIFDTANLGNSYVPSADSLAGLRNQLLRSPAGGVIDLIWTSDLDFKESSSDAYKFLGETKYAQPMMELREGLGIPYGSTGGGGGFNSNYVSMQTLIKRLNNGRQLLVKFWNHEMAIVQKEMGFAKPAVIELDSLSLSDDATRNKLIIEMWDRNLIDDDYVIEHAGFNPSISRSRQKRHAKDREAGRIEEKVGPFNRSEKEMRLASDLKTKEIKEQAKSKPAPVSSNGRPKSSKDSTKRKMRIDAAADLADWKQKSVISISSILYECCEDQEQLSEISMYVLSQLKDHEQVTLDRVVEILGELNV